MGNVEEAIMQFIGEFNQILIQGNLLRVFASGGSTFQMVMYQKFQRMMFWVQRPPSFSMKDYSSLPS